MVPGSHFQGPGCQGPISQDCKSQVPVSQCQGPRVPRPRVPSPIVSSSRVTGLGSRVPGPESWFSGPDFSLCPKTLKETMSFDGKSIKSSDTVELLGITLNKNINFKRHIQNICHKVNNQTKVHLLPEAYISSNFRHCPLIWMSAAKLATILLWKREVGKKKTHS